MRPPPPRALIVLLLAGLMVAVPGGRQATLTVLRAPAGFVRGAFQLVLDLPNLPSLRRTNQQLQDQLMRQQTELAALREAMRHQEAVAALRTAYAEGVIARVIGRSLVPAQHTLWLDRGSEEGLEDGTAVLDAQGVVGRVIDLQPHSALVLLLTDPESRVAALIERSRETGLLVGQGGATARLLYLEHEADVVVEDRVVTAGLGGAFPKGLVLGTVREVTRDSVTGSASATVQLAAGLGRLEEVVCLPPSP